MGIRIRDLLQPGSVMEKFGSGIRNEHPGSATLKKTVEIVPEVKYFDHSLLQKTHWRPTLWLPNVRPVLCVAKARARTFGQVSRRRHLPFVLRQVT
jgi:hypothetical protein